MYRGEKYHRQAKRYVISVQQVQISLGSAATSGTATINPVDPAKTFIIFQGTRCGSVATLRAVAAVTLTDSVTVTATRQQSGTASVVCATVVSCSANLIRSIQTGSIAMPTAGTGAATINPVDTSRSIVIYQGMNGASAAGGSNMAGNYCSLDLANSTTVSAAGSASSQAVVWFAVIEFQPGAVTSVQAGHVVTSSGNTSDTYTLPRAVDMNRAAVFHAGDQVLGNNAQVGMHRRELTNSNTVTAYRTGTSAAARTCACFVVEFAPGVLRGPVQRGTIAPAASASATAAINMIDMTRAWCSYLGNDGGASDTLDQAFSTCNFTDSVTVGCASANAGTHTVNYEVVPFG